MEPFDKNFIIETVSENLTLIRPHRPPEHIERYIPNWGFDLWMYKENDLDFTTRLASFLESIETRILQDYEPVHDSSTGLGDNTVTSRSHNYNLFRETHPTVTKLKTLIETQISRYLEVSNPTVLEDPNFDPHINCWFNVMRPGDQIDVHTHNVTHPFISGHFTVKCEDSFTYYIIPYTRNHLEFVNNIGEGIIFPSFIEHGTSVHNGKFNRISVAWDLYYNKGDVLPAIINGIEPINIAKTS